MAQQIPPRVATFSQVQQFQWSDGTAFNGSAVIMLVPAVQDGTAYATVQFGANPPFVLPASIRLPIVNGTADSVTGIFYNEDINPPFSRYVYWLYDTTHKRVSAASSFFTVTGSTVTLPTLTPTVPSVNATPPDPPNE